MRLGLHLRVSVIAPLLSTFKVSSAFAGEESGQAIASATSQKIDDTWHGTLHAGKDLHTILKISEGTHGTLQAQWYSIDHTPGPLPIKATTFRDGELRLNVGEIDGVYTGKLSPDRNIIVGEWKQGGQTFPLILGHANKETMWAVPEPPNSVAPMAADADPSWEVAYIKAAAPDAEVKGFGGAPRQFKAFDTRLNDIISFAYDVNAEQIVGGPAWMETDKFDITTGEPDQPGAPSQKELKSELHKLMADRFGLKFHPGKKDLSAYVLTVAKDGPKMTNNEADDYQGASFYFTKFGNLVFRDDTLDDFCHGMQGAVFDRPMVNHTGLEGHRDGSLKWKPAETQFQVFGVRIVPDESPDAPPPIFTALQEQIGLKLDVEKTAVDVMIFDHAEKPSDN